MVKYSKAEQSAINKALKIMESKVVHSGSKFTSPDDVKDYLRAKTAMLEHEIFGVLFLNQQHEIIEDEIMFRGTIGSASVYPREIVKEALKKNAAALILYHNHPSGDSRPSEADKRVTAKIDAACKLLDILVLDHIVIGKTATSFAEKGLMAWHVKN